MRFQPIFYTLYLAIALFTTESFAQKNIGGITIPQTLKAGNETLTLNGAGIREKYFFDLYVGALYLKTASSNAPQILDANEPVAIRLHIISDKITSKKMEESVREGFKKSTGNNTAPYQEKIDKLISAFKEDVKVGDIYDIIYTPAGGTKIYKNNTLKSEASGQDFKKVLFGIWLGSDPADEDLKKDMLGK